MQAERRALGPKNSQKTIFNHNALKDEFAKETIFNSKSIDRKYEGEFAICEWIFQNLNLERGSILGSIFYPC